LAFEISKQGYSADNLKVVEDESGGSKIVGMLEGAESVEFSSS